MIFSWGKAIAGLTVMSVVGSGVWYVTSTISENKKMAVEISKLQAANAEQDATINWQRTQATLSNDASKALQKAVQDMAKGNRIDSELVKRLEGMYEDYKPWRNTKQPNAVNERMQARRDSINKRLGLSSPSTPDNTGAPARVPGDAEREP